MKRLYLVAGGAFLVAAIAAVAWFERVDHSLKFDTGYQAVLLDNGQVFYGQLGRVDADYMVLTDVYYVERQAEAQTKEVKNVLIRRGSEWHAPNRTVISAKHVVMIEPVTPGSKVAELIAALNARGQ